jgi:RNA polymerase sigma-70 factor, ECF subfamily
LQTFVGRYGMLAGMRGQEAAAGREELDRVERARQGDERAFAELVETHLQRVWRVVWHILRHQQDTEDVVQEVFLAAYRALDTYRGDSLFSTWLHRIAVNRALNHRSLAAERMRRASRSIEPPEEEDEGSIPALPDAGPSPLQELEMKDLKRRLAACLEKMPTLWRAVVALRDGESLSYEEIARQMEIALGTVRSRLARARLSLRRCLHEEAA